MSDIFFQIVVGTESDFAVSNLNNEGGDECLISHPWPLVMDPLHSQQLHHLSLSACPQWQAEVAGVSCPTLGLADQANHPDGPGVSMVGLTSKSTRMSWGLADHGLCKPPLRLGSQNSHSHVTLPF
jgi:hypothetical protein